MFTMNKWRKFIGLSARERWLLSQSLVLLPFAAAALSVMGLRRYQRLMDRFSRAIKPDVAGDERELRDRVRKTARLVEAARRYGPYRAKCLPESLTLWWLLRRQGIESQVKFGARKNDRRMEAHAWVEFEGVPLNDTTDVMERFKPFEPAVLPEELKT
ncbi:MAG TPA: lasso peptide biosynthesis B2 protein [Blastocatellia bacterium]|nr:lasso peptide biosynthesis B2 protein [Blastocatellia bacterium]